MPGYSFYAVSPHRDCCRPKKDLSSFAFKTKLPESTLLRLSERKRKTSLLDVCKNLPTRITAQSSTRYITLPCYCLLIRKKYTGNLLVGISDNCPQLAIIKLI